MSAEDVSRLLDAHQRGDPEALGRVMSLVYRELRRIAGRYLRSERTDHTLQPTALVHEAYLRLVGTEQQWHGRAHFLACAAQAMRRVLVDHARARRTSKRGGEMARVSLYGVDVAATERVDLEALDEALDALASLKDRLARVVELKYFGGLTIEETAQVLGISTAAARRDWTVARAWLRRELTKREP